MRDDDYTFGVLHPGVHELWARGTGTQLREVESGFRFTPTTTFETFPFPRPTWLANAHADLDRAVLDAYGWPADHADEAVLERLLALNLAREPA